MATEVIDHPEPGAVYIGRGSPFGNPYAVGHSSFPGAIIVSTVEEAVEAYHQWMTGKRDAPGWIRPTRAQVAALKGKKLRCFKHNPCHGHLLAVWAERYG